MTSTDVPALGRILALPMTVWSARWILEPLGDTTSPFAGLGPTDHRLLAFLRFAADPPLATADDQRPQAVARSLASAVLPDGMLEELVVLGDEVMIAGPFRDASSLQLMPYRVKWAADVAGGLLVYALTY